jgi:hypothetical protein
MNYVKNNVLNNIIIKIKKEQRHFNKAKLYDKTFYQLLMWFWPVNAMIELVSGMPVPQFGDESS